MSEDKEKNVIDDLKKKIKVTPEAKKSKKKANPYDVVIATAEKALEKKDKHYSCIHPSLPRAYISCGPFTVSAFTAKLVDTGTGWMELSAPTPGSFIAYTEDQAEELVEQVKARVVVWEDNDRVRCSIYRHDYKHKQPGFSAEPLAKYVVFEKANEMSAEQVLSPETMPTLYDKAENELSRS